MVVLTLSLSLWLLAEGEVCNDLQPALKGNSCPLTVVCIGSSLTRGFPSLEELIRNGSLLERYSTHDGEMRSVPGVRWNCSGSGGQISKITFIALPGVGIERPTLRIVRGPNDSQDIEISGETQTFGEFGFEVTVNTNIMFNDGDMLLIRHPPYEDSSLRLLHQVGDVARDVCIGPPDLQNCQTDYDYPLLAIETGKCGKVILLLYSNSDICRSSRMYRRTGDSIRTEETVGEQNSTCTLQQS